MKAKEIIKLNNWVVIGDVTNKNKYASRILNKFKDKEYNVVGIHPKGGEDVYTKLKDVPYNIEAIDLCINSKLGLEYLKEAKDLGIKNILIQPGAESEEIINYCIENNLEYIEDCALVQLNNL